ncbi:SbcC/MukB-like Walker B domain-containing protein [Amycolatopsis japonica]
MEFRAIETRADGAEIVHEGVTGMSGGEGQELIAFIMGAALRCTLQTRCSPAAGARPRLTRLGCCC